MDLMKKVLMIVAFSLSQFTYADTPTQESVERLINAMGIKESIIEQKVALDAQGEQAANQITAEIAVGFSELPEELKTEFSLITSAYMNNVSSMLDEEKLASVYGDLLSKQLDQNQINEVLIFFTSDIGKKFTSANVGVSKQFTEFMMRDLNSQLGSEMQKLMADLKKATDIYRAKNS